MNRRFIKRIVITAGIIVLAGILSTRIPGVIAVTDVNQAIRNALDKIEKQYENIWTQIKTVALNQAAESYLNRLAYETANWLASGAPGAKPLQRRESFGRILEQTGEAALGDFIGSISELDSFQNMGLDLCNPSPDLKLDISLQLLDSKAPPPPRCDIRKVQENWRNLGQNISSNIGVTVDASKSGTAGAQAGVNIPWLGLTQNLDASERLDTFNELFSPAQSDLGAYILLSDKQKEIKAARDKASEMTLASCGGYKDVESKITNDYVHRTCDELKRVADTTQSPNPQVDIERLFGSENTLWVNAAKIFGRTLTSKLLSNIITSGSWTLADVNGNNSLNAFRESIISVLQNNATGILSTGGNAVSLSDLQLPALDTVSNYDFLTNLSACPPDRNNVEADNCTIDSNFVSAVEERQTVGEALAGGRLQADMPLISNLNIVANNDTFCVRTGYCYSNIIRLRKYRVLPVGWEIAASLSPIDKPITLGQAVACFENSSSCPLRPDENVYYHLIDPNWVLKAPETQCRALAYGPKLVGIDSAERQQYCADNVSCLAEDDSGSCTGGYGYCTKERNIWRFAGIQCQAQFASCDRFTRTSDSASFNYVGNTVDRCDASQAGCWWYSKGQDNIGSEAEPVLAWNPEDRIYFNKQAPSCDASQAGCSQYISLLTPGVNLVANGDFDTFQPDSATDYSAPDWLNDSLADDFDGWRSTGLTTMTTGNDVYTGTVGARLQDTGQLSTSVITGILADKTFTLSWYAKSTSPTCTADVSIGSLSLPPESRSLTYTNGWQRYQLSQKYDVNNLDTSANISFSGCDDGSELFFDGVKFEFNAAATDFSAYGDNGFVYAKSQNQCTKEDVGCDLYTPILSGVTVPGKVDSGDFCPAECVGYQNYLELSSNFDALESLPNPPPTPRSLNFIANTAPSCPATEVDCEEFTNLDEVAQGGEGKYYYSYVRQCVEDALGVTYYTLEGSDTAGYQVRTWRLLPNSSGAPCTNVDVGGTTCLDTAGNTVATTCTAADLATNLDCREFFDIQGQAHYKLQSRVIFASAECQPLRRSLNGTVFNALPGESRSCGAANNGCRAYRGNQGNNVRTIFSDDFESGNFAPWTNVSLSSEAVTTGGNSIANTANNITRPLDTLLGFNHSYYLNFWMKNTQAATLQFSLNLTGLPQPSNFNVVTVPASGWQVYALGPLSIAQAKGYAATLSASINSGAAVYLDNIQLSEATTNLYVVRDRWVTPTSCDTPLPGAMLGCQTYANTASQQYNLKSFSRLCSEDVIGCQAFVNTNNSSDPFQRTFNSGDRSEVTVPADDLSYLVYTEANSCFSSNKGCTALGRPQFNLDLKPDDPRYIAGYGNSTLINDPDAYGQTLCLDSGLFCEEFTNSAKGLNYFKDPLNRTCTYKEDISVEGQLTTGWFQTKSLASGTSPIGCSDDGVLPYESSDYQVYQNIEQQYDRWVGMCPTNQTSCTEFVDTQAGQGGEVLANARFNAIPLGSSWTYADIGTANSLNDLRDGDIGNNGINDAFALNTLDDSATLRSTDDGASIHQDVSINPTVVYTLSANATIMNMAIDADSFVHADVECYMESARDDDTVFSSGYCHNTASGDDTAVSCAVNGDCAALGAGYTCDTNWLAIDLNKPSNPDRDHVTYVRDSAVVDPGLFRHSQSLRTTVDLRPTINNDQLSYCRVSLGFNAANYGGAPNPYNEVLWDNVTMQPAKTYYYLDNNDVDTKSCNGQVSQKNGCLLFLNSGDNGRLYSASESYDRSRANNSNSVAPIGCSVANSVNGVCFNDVNRIVKVDRDRECAEWLACRSTTEVFDTSTNSYRTVCDQVGTCDKYSSSDAALHCADWVEPGKEKLDYAVYVSRDLNFDAVDYSGYSAYNAYPVGSLELIDVSNDGAGGPDGRNPDYRLVKVIDSCDSDVSYDKPCGPADVLGNRTGRCFAPDKCAVGIDGSPFDRKSDKVIPLSTRAWAEKDSPFPHSIIENETQTESAVKFGFQQAHICDNSNASCESRYYKFQYGTGGDVTHYYSADLASVDTDIPNCLCQGGFNDGLACLTNDDNNDNTLSTEERCPDNGQPLYLRRTESFLNWPGYCLERDRRNPVNASTNEFACLSWLPVDNSPSGFDFFNQNREAGYSYKIPAYYCLEVGLMEYRSKFLVDCRCSNDRPDSLDPNYYIDKVGSCGNCSAGTRNKYNYYMKPNGGDGWYPYDGIFSCASPTCDQSYTELGPDPSCKVLAQAVNERGENAAVTNLFWSDYGAGQGYTVSGLGYKLNQDDTAFGSAVPNNSLGLITEQLVIRGKKQIPRAGSPYACTSSPESCARFDQNSGDKRVAVQGFTAPPSSAWGDETYAEGLERLQEIYKKIFNLYSWSTGNACAYSVCAPVSGNNAGYFGGQECSTAETNACNPIANQASCQTIRNLCVNSVFNSTDSASPLYRTCASCPVGFVTETNPSKRCQSANGYVDAATCQSVDLDPSPGITTTCSSLAAQGYSCSQNPVDAKYYCYNGIFQGNDCKLPTDSNGNLIASYLTCQTNSQGKLTCHYDGADTGVACSANTDCTAPDDAIDDNLVGSLAEINQTAYCADSFIEGPKDAGSGDFCIGGPFTSTLTGTDNYIFNESPVRCGLGDSYTNLLGYTLNGPSVCTSVGSCQSSSSVANQDGSPVCKVTPNAYRSFAPDPGITMDLTANDTVAHAPFVIPVTCDSSGVNCTQAMPTIEFDVPDGPGALVNDNGFTVNNGQDDEGLAGFQVVGYENLLASLKFYMSAYKDHMPVRYIEIVWGDGQRQNRVGYYQNHMDQCGDPAALGPNLPPTGTNEALEYAATTQACRANYINYLHVYDYNKTYDTDGDGIATYSPRIMVQDNWGWCSNGVYGETGLGCGAAGFVDFPGVIKVHKDARP